MKTNERRPSALFIYFYNYTGVLFGTGWALLRRHCSVLLLLLASPSGLCEVAIAISLPIDLCSNKTYHFCPWRLPINSSAKLSPIIGLLKN